MSFNPEIPEIQPLPDHDTFVGAFEITEESFVKSAWEDVAGHMSRLRDDPFLRQGFLEVAAYGRLLGEEDLADVGEVYSSEAPRFLIGSAYAHGFLQQFTPSQLLYSDLYSFEQALSLLHRNYNTQNFQAYGDKESLSRAQGEYTMGLGEYGLSRVGGAAQQYLERWAEDAFLIDKRLQRAFMFGHGAMVVCGMNYQTAINEQLVSVWSRRINFDEEAKTLFNPSSGEDK